MRGAFGRHGRLRCDRAALAELAVGPVFHGQVIIEAASSAPAATDDSPSQMAEAISPAAIRVDRFGTGTLTM